jgi:hypothetical protein
MLFGRSGGFLIRCDDRSLRPRDCLPQTVSQSSQWQRHSVRVSVPLAVGVMVVRSWLANGWSKLPRVALVELST